jgi:hypothetical protein
MARVLGLEAVVHAEGQLSSYVLQLIKHLNHRFLDVDWKSNTLYLALSSFSCSTQA